MKENKFTTYFLYAIGEILLVVVGILIAVKIDNLNQEKEEEIRQKQYYSGIITDLRRDSVHFETLMGAIKMHQEAFYMIYEAIKEYKEISPRSFELMMYNRTFAPVTQKNHQTTIDKITNVEIRGLLNDYFASQELTAQGFDEFNQTVVEDSRPHFLFKHNLNYEAVFHDDMYGFLPSEPLVSVGQVDALLKDEYTLKLLTSLRISGGLIISDLKKLLKRNTDLIIYLKQASKKIES